MAESSAPPPAETLVSQLRKAASLDFRIEIVTLLREAADTLEAQYGFHQQTPSQSPHAERVQADVAASPVESKGQGQAEEEDPQAVKAQRDEYARRVNDITQRHVAAYTRAEAAEVALTEARQQLKDGPTITATVTAGYNTAPSFETFEREIQTLQLRLATLTAERDNYKAQLIALNADASAWSARAALAPASPEGDTTTATEPSSLPAVGYFEKR